MRIPNAEWRPKEGVWLVQTGQHAETRRTERLTPPMFDVWLRGNMDPDDDRARSEVLGRIGALRLKLVDWRRQREHMQTAIGGATAEVRYLRHIAKLMGWPSVVRKHRATAKLAREEEDESED